MMKNRILVSTRKGLFEFHKEGNALVYKGVHFEGDHCALSHADERDDSIYAVLDHGHFGTKLHRSDDGKSWKELPVPVYPEKPDDFVDVHQPAEGEPVDWKLRLVWAFANADAEKEGTLWCGTIPGGLFYSDDKGESWELNRPLWDDPMRGEWFGGGMILPGIHSICVDPRDKNHVVVGISCGGVWHTRDGGESWECACKGMRADFMPEERSFDENIQDPHLLVQCQSDPSRMWVQHHNGIFRSEDEGRTWSEIHEAGPSTFGFAVTAHPKDPDTAWFVPGKSDELRIPINGEFVVTKTTDGGETFEVQSNGLPAPAWDIVFRHGMDVDDDGDFLVMGSTTGGLFASFDGGNNWECVHANLPQIYAVQIG